ncbi:MAG: hypothetical protein A3F16_00285 [Deltaproteobacteria bacterium RIFCSPHIGHO2_12_FULL_43_9]|nr:MAG: hypothetical protein A3F16_00285 [Deltaproteobacteria bacterium RIFCSPHIGHO2_12_FULL_43_9]
MVFDPSHNPYIARCKEYYGWLIDETDASKFRGGWRDVLKKERLIVEIGPGNGWFLVDYLKTHPEDGYVAIEKQYKRGVRCAEKLIRNNLINGKIIRGKGELLKDYFNDGEVAKVIINFPTPWVKERHKKHILFSDSFSEDLYKVLGNDGKLLIKSDHYQYMNVVVEKLSGQNFLIYSNKEGDEASLPPFPTFPGYERRFREDGRGIFTIQATKHQ